MAILSKGHDFSSGDNVTATKLDDLVDQATFVGGSGGATDNSTLEVNDGVGGDGSLRVKDLGITTAKLADGAVSTQKIADGAVTSDKISTTDTNFNVQSDGKIGIGTASPDEKIHISGTNASLRIDSGTNYGDKSLIILCNERTHIESEIIGPTAQGDTNLKLKTLSGGTLADRITIDEFGRVGIGTSTPNESALLDVSTTTGGILFPRLTTTQRDVVVPYNGLVIYNTTVNKFQGIANGQWVDLH